MTPDEVDAFFAFRGKTLPASPEWRDGNRISERRTSLAVSVNGIVSPVTIELTIRLNDPPYFMGLMLVAKSVICRLCMTTGHRDRITGLTINSAHFHGWEANRGGRKTIPKNLNRVEEVPSGIDGRDAALAWFLDRTGVEPPTWASAAWPPREGLF